MNIISSSLTSQQKPLLKTSQQIFYDLTHSKYREHGRSNSDIARKQSKDQHQDQVSDTVWTQYRDQDQDQDQEPVIAKNKSKDHAAQSSVSIAPKQYKDRNQADQSSDSDEVGNDFEMVDAPLPHPNDIFHCSICLFNPSFLCEESERLIIVQIVRTEGCSHWFCATCWKPYLAHKVLEGVTHITCPVSNRKISSK